MIMYGIDPDAHGALAALRADGTWCIAPLDLADGTNALEVVTRADTVVLESLPYIPTNGRRGMQTQAMRWGALRERLRAIGCEVIDVAPRTWQAAMRLTTGRSESKKSHKLRIHATAEKLCGQSLDAGFGDAVCLAYWGVKQAPNESHTRAKAG